MQTIALALLFLATPPARELEDRLHRILDEPELVPGMRLKVLSLGEDRAALGLELPAPLSLSELPPEVENLYELAVGAIAAERPDIERIDLAVAHPGQTLRPPRAAPRPGGRKVVTSYAVLPDPARFPDGQALLGKTI